MVFSLHTFNVLVAKRVITPIFLPMQKQVRFDKHELDRLIDEARDVTTPAGMPESMPGKARNFADFLKKIEGTDNANH